MYTFVIRLVHNDRHMATRYDMDSCLERVRQLQQQGLVVYYECVGWSDVYAS